MPEVVEVALTSQYLNHKLKNKIITGIDIIGGRYSRHPLKGLADFKNNLPLIIDKVESKGKFMWFELHNKKKDYYIMNTYGLEGEWGFEKKTHSNILFKIKHNTKDRVYNLYFTDSRNFGTLEMTSNKNKLDNKLDSLGPDFLKTSFTNQEFENRIKDYLITTTTQNGKISTIRANRKIIKVLMDQKATSGLGCGLGNYLAVEILYKSKISPHKTIGDIYNNKALINKLSKSIKYVTKLAYMTANVGYLAHLDNKLDKWVKKIREKINKDKYNKYHYHRDIDLKNAKFKFNVYRQKTDPKGYKVKSDKIIPGRTTYWVPKVQN